MVSKDYLFTTGPKQIIWNWSQMINSMDPDHIGIRQLGGGFKHVLFSTLLGEMIQLD